ncbi:pentatricopeptide repeat-containing protein At5g61800-like [Syzygium oleosum]|uniref:pentatricopeptide repeat-containing protein At5g61800-like n=1 Tax=Syzygium oleosum TaxID=219896 RepID=UPI0024B9D5D6|nr:pentatricopeptide repeat-containing protein At5g61800-like [Syzygium oleosum]
MHPTFLFEVSIFARSLNPLLKKMHGSCPFELPKGRELMLIPSSSALLAVLKKCSSIKHLHQVHAQAIASGLLAAADPSPVLTRILFAFTALVPAPSFLSSPSAEASASYASSVFRAIRGPTTFCYNTIIRAHTLLASPVSALLLFVEMRRLGLPLDFHSFPFALKACAQLQALSLARALHCQALKLGLAANLFIVNSLVRVNSACGHAADARRVFDESSCRDVVSFNSMIDCLVKSGDVENARRLFEEMPERDAVSWGTLLAGYAQTNQCDEAIRLFDIMIASGIQPDNVAIVSALSACAQLCEIDHGKKVHAYIRQYKIRIDCFLYCGLVDMYMKCGCIEIAMELFEVSAEKNVHTWNALLVGLGMHGYGHSSLDYFSKMVFSGLRPDGVSILGVLVGCSHAGLIREASEIFDKMESVYGVVRELKHYGCMADLLARAGLVKEAEDMIHKMPMRGDIFVWGGLLGGCKIHGNVETAEKAARSVMELCPKDGGAYSIMANIYTSVNRWDDVVKTRRSLSASAAKKSPGCSMIKLNGISHEFLSTDSWHPEIEEVYFVLHLIGQHQQEGWY